MLNQIEMFEKKNRATIQKKMPSGKRFEDVVESLLLSDGWLVKKQFLAGFKLGKRTKHRVDFHVSKENVDLLVSCKYQHSPGTAFEKLPYEYMCLLNAVERNIFTGAVLILFGEVLRKENMFSVYIDELSPFMKISSKITVCGFEEFMAHINRGTFLDVK